MLSAPCCLAGSGAGPGLSAICSQVSLKTLSSLYMKELQPGLPIHPCQGIPIWKMAFLFPGFLFQVCLSSELDMPLWPVLEHTLLAGLTHTDKARQQQLRGFPHLCCHHTHWQVSGLGLFQCLWDVSCLGGSLPQCLRMQTSDWKDIPKC